MGIEKVNRNIEFYRNVTQNNIINIKIFLSGGFYFVGPFQIGRHLSKQEPDLYYCLIVCTNITYYCCIGFQKVYGAITRC